MYFVDYVVPVSVNPVPRLHSRGIGALPFGDKAHSSPPVQAGLPVVRGEGRVIGERSFARWFLPPERCVLVTRPASL